MVPEAAKKRSSRKWLVAVTVVAIVVVAVVAGVLALQYQKRLAPAKLDIEVCPWADESFVVCWSGEYVAYGKTILPYGTLGEFHEAPLAGHAGQTLLVPIFILNDGGEATGISITMTARGLGNFSFSPVDAPNGVTRLNESITVPDVNNSAFRPDVLYTYNDASGTHTFLQAAATTYAAIPVLVYPTVKLVDLSWEGGINYVGSNGTTTFAVSIQSLSPKASYDHLSILADLGSSPGQGLTIQSEEGQAGNEQISGIFGMAANDTLSATIGPLGTSLPLRFTIRSTDAIAGQYQITIVAFSRGWQVVNMTTILMVKP